MLKLKKSIYLTGWSKFLIIAHAMEFKEGDTVRFADQQEYSHYGNEGLNVKEIVAVPKEWQGATGHPQWVRLTRLTHLNGQTFEAVFDEKLEKWVFQFPNQVACLPNERYYPQVSGKLLRLTDNLADY